MKVYVLFTVELRYQTLFDDYYEVCAALTRPRIERCTTQRHEARDWGAHEQAFYAWFHRLSFGEPRDWSCCHIPGARTGCWDDKNFPSRTLQEEAWQKLLTAWHDRVIKHADWDRDTLEIRLWKRVRLHQ